MDLDQGRESDNLEDRRSMSPAKLAIGGIGGLILMLVSAYFGIDLNQFVNTGQQEVRNGDKAETRPANAEDERSRKFYATILGFTEDVWGEQFRKAGHHYVPPHMVLFSKSVETGCGEAPSAVGPFYCPADKTVYLDPTFFNELEQKLGGSKAEFSQAYVIAHEVGHHVQNLLGYTKLAHEKERTVSKNHPHEWSVRLELQADYLAGVWAHYGQEKFHFIQAGDIESAIKTVKSIGDDRLQVKVKGFTYPETYTHGTSAQRLHWFREGLKTGDMRKLKVIFETPYDEL
jgi:uncharacterized protein